MTTRPPRMHLRLAAGGVVLASGGRCGGRRVETGLKPGQRDLGRPPGLALVVASPLVLSSEYECPFGFVSLAFQLFAMFMAVVLDPCSDDFACRLKISHEGRIILEF